VVRNVELVVLHLVVWAPVFVLALAVAMVAATVFEAVFHNVGGDGSCAACGIVVAQSGVGVILRVVLLMLTRAEMG
jgi:hypothetical protein